MVMVPYPPWPHDLLPSVFKLSSKIKLKVERYWFHIVKEFWGVLWCFWTRTMTLASLGSWPNSNQMVFKAPYVHHMLLVHLLQKGMAEIWNDTIHVNFFLDPKKLLISFAILFCFLINTTLENSSTSYILIKNAISSPQNFPVIT